MPEKLDQIFSPLTLLALNMIIILSAEFVGGGKYFFDTGIIHALAIGFIILAASRIYWHYYSYDAFLEKFFHAVIAALLVFAAAHFAEFISYKVLMLSEDATFANVANFYIVSLLVIVMGAEMFLAVHDRRSRLVLWITGMAAVIFVGLSTALFLNDELISLEADSAAPYLYAVLSVLAGALAFVRAEKIGRLVSISRNFIDYLLAAIALIVLSVLPNVFYEILEDAGLPDHQVIYVSHFLFYAALSLIFLSFRATANLPGVYADVGAVDGNRGNSTPLAK